MLRMSAGQRRLNKALVQPSARTACRLVRLRGWCAPAVRLVDVPQLPLDIHLIAVRAACWRRLLVAPAVAAGRVAEEQPEPNTVVGVGEGYGGGRVGVDRAAGGVGRVRAPARRHDGGTSQQQASAGECVRRGSLLRTAWAGRGWAPEPPASRRPASSPAAATPPDHNTPLLQQAWGRAAANLPNPENAFASLARDGLREVVGPGAPACVGKALPPPPAACRARPSAAAAAPRPHPAAGPRWSQASSRRCSAAPAGWCGDAFVSAAHKTDERSTRCLSHLLAGEDEGAGVGAATELHLSARSSLLNCQIFGKQNQDSQAI